MCIIVLCVVVYVCRSVYVCGHVCEAGGDCFAFLPPMNYGRIKQEKWEGQRIERKGCEIEQEREGHWGTRSNSEQIGSGKWQSITILNILSKSNLLRSCHRTDICTLLGRLPYILRSQPPNLPESPFTHKLPVHLSYRGHFFLCNWLVNRTGDRELKGNGLWCNYN